MEINVNEHDILEIEEIEEFEAEIEEIEIFDDYAWFDDARYW